MVQTCTYLYLSNCLHIGEGFESISKFLIANGFPIKNLLIDSNFSPMWRLVTSINTNFNLVVKQVVTLSTISRLM